MTIYENVETLSSSRSRSVPVWYVVALLTAVNAVAYMDRMALSLLAPAVKRDLDLSDAQLGLLLGFAFSAFYATCAIPIARLADKASRKSIIATSIAVWSLMTAASGAAQNFWQMFVARMGIGAGESGVVPAAQSMICDYVPPRRRPGMFAVHSFGSTAGMVVGMIAAGLLVEQIGWRLTFLAIGLPGLVLALVVHLTIEEPARGRLEEIARKEDAAFTFAHTLRFAFKSRTYLLLISTLVISTFASSAITQWWPTFFARNFGLSAANIGAALGLALGLGGAIGAIGGGFIANKLAARGYRLPLIALGIVKWVMTPLSIGVLVAPSAGWSFTFVALMAIAGSSSVGVISAAIFSVMDPRGRATAGALSSFLPVVLGASLGPFMVGFLSDHLAGSFGADSLKYALMVPPFMLPLAGVAMIWAARSINSEVASVSGAAEFT